MQTKTMRFFRIMVTAASIVFFLAPRAPAGQIVTDETRQWARDALDREKNLDLAGTPDTLAVLYFNNKTENSRFDLLSKGLALMLMTDLSRMDRIRVLERIKLQALVDELGFQSSDLTRKQTDVRIGKLMGAEFLVGGDILKKDDGSFVLSSSLLNVPTKEVFGNPESSGKLLEDLFAMEKKLLFEIIHLLNIKLTEKQEQDLQKPLTTDVQAFIYFVQGVEESDKGNFEKAESLYEKAVERDPEFTPAKEASRELLKPGNIRPAAKRRILLKAQKARTSFTDRLIPNYPNKRLRFPQNMIPTCEVRIDWDTTP